MRRFFILFSLIFCFFFFSCSKPGDLKINRAIKSYQTQNYEESLKLLNEALTEETNYSQDLIYNLIASIYLQQDDLENAVIYQEKIVEKNPEYRNLVSLGMTYHLLSRDSESEATYKKAIALKPEKGEAYASLGALYLGQKDIPNAVENLKKASELEPKVAMIHANLAVAYSAAKNPEKAEEEFKIAEDLKCENLDEFKTRAENF